ncbi:hypothetical protein E1292_22055 [Nonomuraea deserti]|uniref:Uncharacterized protein n=1 Tax=Nonomuraea deserti TaxID=1848322 RepID=A0A4R4VS83_9ACTN|nr:hypothetical protein [Nonomuraea deserti]TDD03070.1 hypothetical protein E1292_22055 [Nonomuraea deserti]
MMIFVGMKTSLTCGSEDLTAIAGMDSAWSSPPLLVGGKGVVERHRVDLYVIRRDHHGCALVIRRGRISCEIAQECLITDEAGRNDALHVGEVHILDIQAEVPTMAWRISLGDGHSGQFLLNDCP